MWIILSSHVFLYVFLSLKWQLERRNVATVEQLNAARVAARNERLARIANSNDCGWQKVNVNEHRFVLPPMTAEESFAAVDKRKATSLVDIFLSFVTPDVLTATWHFFPKEYWCYGYGPKAGTFNKGQVSLKLMYTYLAVYIFLVGEQNPPREGQGVQRPLRSGIQRAINHFKKEHPGEAILSPSLLEAFWGRFNIPHELWPQICRNFQDLLIRPGRCAAGDEKLLRFTGDSGYIRLVPSKPDHVGLWFFELVYKEKAK